MGKTEEVPESTYKTAALLIDAEHTRRVAAQKGGFGVSVEPEIVEPLKRLGGSRRSALAADVRRTISSWRPRAPRPAAPAPDAGRATPAPASETSHANCLGGLMVGATFRPRDARSEPRPRRSALVARLKPNTYGPGRMRRGPLGMRQTSDACLGVVITVCRLAGSNVAIAQVRWILLG